MFAATLGRLEFQFRRVRIHGHTLTRGIRETLRLELRQRERLGTRPEVLATVRTNQSLSQPSQNSISFYLRPTARYGALVTTSWPSRSNEQIFYGKQEDPRAPKERTMLCYLKKQCVA